MSKQQVTMNYIEEIIITNDTKKIRQYQTSRYFFKPSANSLGTNTQFL